jgi:hypothetical protein
MYQAGLHDDMMYNSTFDWTGALRAIVGRFPALKDEPHLVALLHAEVLIKCETAMSKIISRLRLLNQSFPVAVAFVVMRWMYPQSAPDRTSLAASLAAPMIDETYY